MVHCCQREITDVSDHNLYGETDLECLTLHGQPRLTWCRLAAKLHRGPCMWN